MHCQQNIKIGNQVSYTDAKESEDSSLRINTHSSGLLTYYVKEVDFVQTSAFVLYILSNETQFRASKYFGFPV